MDDFAFRLLSLIALGVVVAKIIAYVVWGDSKGRKFHGSGDLDALIDF